MFTLNLHNYERGDRDPMVVTMPYSEVCMHMRVAGKQMIVERRGYMAQLYTLAGNKFSFPITDGEAGIHNFSYTGKSARLLQRVMFEHSAR
jgi:hypothetical protein